MQNDNPADFHRAEAQAWLAAIVESSDDAIVSKTLEGVITSWNHGAERIFGYTSDDVVGKSITVIIPPDRLSEEPEILRRIRAGERVDHFETIRRRKDGRLIEVSVTISPIRDASGKVVGVSKVARDISVQKEFQRALEAAKSEADRAKEMAESANRAKDHFLSVLSHELRTPLTPVLAAVSLIERNGGSLPEELHEQIRMIRRNIETEARLVDDLLDVTRIARGKVRLHFEVVDAHVAVRDAVAMFQSEIDAKGLAVTLALRAKDSHVWADPSRFQQIVANLLSNAVKFTPDEGAITVCSSNEHGALKLEVADSGVGIEPDLLPRLFEPFEQGERTVTRQFGGLGLGLSIVRSLVELHKASISVASEGKGKGSAFTLRVPTVPPSQPSAPAPAAVGAAHKEYRVLLVEDHDDTREVMQKLLRSLGCAVTTAATVREAVEAAERQTFDLLLSDIGLPDGSGIDVMRFLSQHQAVRGIALSGFGQDEDRRRSREAGFETHLIKPVSFKTLHEAIQKLAN